MQAQKFRTKQWEAQEICSTIERSKDKNCYPNLHLSLGHGCNSSGTIEKNDGQEISKTETETTLSLSLSTTSSRQKQIQYCSENHKKTNYTHIEKWES